MMTRVACRSTSYVEEFQSVHAEEMACNGKWEITECEQPRTSIPGHIIGRFRLESEWLADQFSKTSKSPQLSTESFNNPWTPYGLNSNESSLRFKLTRIGFWFVFTLLLIATVLILAHVPDFARKIQSYVTDSESRLANRLSSERAKFQRIENITSKEAQVVQGWFRAKKNHTHRIAQ